ncbi:AMP-binding protein [Enterovibrio norvegicus]|uniref:AMP-binding protein n=1 Tax=Enterovibrio norvegicus TaxID=188144 RepID=UPI0013D631AB|nr:AMP-binding protein [Enterovibrio norvegicus]
MSLIPLAQLLACERPHDHPVAFSDNHTATWAQFQHDVSSLTAHFEAKEEQRWALAFDDSYLFATAFLALCHARKNIVLPGNLQPGALNELRPHFDAIVHDERIQLLANTPAVSLPYAEVNTHANLSRPAPFNAVTLTLFTSGSSSTPKAIVKQLSQLQAELNQLEFQWGESLSNTRVQSTVSHQHIYGLLFRVLWPLSAGRAFSCSDLVYPEQVTAEAQSDATLISSPALLKRLEGQCKHNEYRAVFSSGGPLPFDASTHSEQLLGQRPVEVYGSTETGGIGFRQQTLSTQPWQLFDDIRAELDEHGCLRLLSPYIDANAWYQTADLCDLINDTQFVLKGRADRVIKLEEKRVSLSEIEQRLCENTWISDAASLVLSLDERQVVAAVVVLSPEGQRKVADVGKGKFQLALRQQLRDWLEPIAIPRQLRFVNAIPQNSQGKRQKQVIESLFSPTSSTNE